MELSWGQWHWFDLVLLLIILRGGYRGFQLGFARAFLGLAGLLVAFPVAGLLTPTVADFLDRQWQAAERVASFLSERITLPAGLAAVDLRSVSVTELLERLQDMKLPPAYVDALAELFDKLVIAATAQGAETVGEFLFVAMGAILVNTFVFIILFSAIRGLFDFAARGLSRRVGLGVIGFMNRTAGFAFSAITTTLGIMIVLGLISPLLSLNWLAFLNNIVSQSMLAGGLLRVFYLVSPWIIRSGRLGG